MLKTQITVRSWFRLLKWFITIRKEREIASESFKRAEVSHLHINNVVFGSSVLSKYQSPKTPTAIEYNIVFYYLDKQHTDVGHEKKATGSTFDDVGK